MSLIDRYRDKIREMEPPRERITMRRSERGLVGSMSLDPTWFEDVIRTASRQMNDELERQFREMVMAYPMGQARVTDMTLDGDVLRATMTVTPAQPVEYVEMSYVLTPADEDAYYEADVVRTGVPNRNGTVISPQALARMVINE